MSHSYYLYRDGDPCPECGHERRETIVPIGHSGGGWVFLWQGHRDLAASPLNRQLTTPAEWFAALRDETDLGATIVDSYGKQTTLAEFQAYVLAKREPRQGQPPLRHSALDTTWDCVPVDGDDVDFHPAGHATAPP